MPCCALEISPSGAMLVAAKNCALFVAFRHDSVQIAHNFSSGVTRVWSVGSLPSAEASCMEAGGMVGLWAGEPRNGWVCGRVNRRSATLHCLVRTQCGCGSENRALFAAFWCNFVQMLHSFPRGKAKVARGGLEPPTLRFSVVCSTN